MFFCGNHPGYAVPLYCYFVQCLCVVILHALWKLGTWVTAGCSPRWGRVGLLLEGLGENGYYQSCKTEMNTSLLAVHFPILQSACKWCHNGRAWTISAKNPSVYYYSCGDLIFNIRNVIWHKNWRLVSI